MISNGTVQFRHLITFGHSFPFYMVVASEERPVIPQERSMAKYPIWRGARDTHEVVGGWAGRGSYTKANSQMQKSKNMRTQRA